MLSLHVLLSCHTDNEYRYSLRDELPILMKNIPLKHNSHCGVLMVNLQLRKIFFCPYISASVHISVCAHLKGELSVHGFS